MSDYIDKLRDAIRKLHGCESKHVATSPIKETFEGETVWDGDVQIFELIGHPTANRCYAWGHQLEGDKARYVAVLETPEVRNALDAVRLATIQEHKSKGQRNG